MKRFTWGALLVFILLLGLLYLLRWVEASGDLRTARVAYATQKWQVAADASSDAIRVAPPFFPERARAFTERGKARYHLQQYPQVIDDLAEAIRLDPNNAEAYRFRGVAYLAQGQLDRGFADLSEAIRLDPSDASARYNRGVAYARKADYDQALTDLGEAIRLNRSDAQAYLARSRVYAKKGDDAQAKADERKAAELDPALGRSGGGNP
jgi:tetratricopeptide (TPR) repeat protein